MRSVDHLARRQAIEQYHVLDQPTEPDLQGLVELAAIVCEVPTAVVNLIDDRHQHQIAAVGFAPGVCEREDSMCAAVLGEARRVEVPDAREDPRFAGNPFVTGEIAKVRFYASSPLVTPDGVVIGTLCVFDDATGELGSEAAHGLDVLARQVVDVLELRRTARELARSNEQLAQFAGQVSHDLRNPLAALSGFLEMAADSESLEAAPDVARALGRAESSARRMERLISELLEYAQVGGRVRTRPVGIGLSTCERIVAAHGGRMGIDTSPLGGASVWAILPDHG